ncbi:MAG: hypothetical protein LBG80_00995 [Bacteroidales bacterium]|jgi:hypothetical protein|nr:hypothetical protein [Bacteroidales bacterium]
MKKILAAAVLVTALFAAQNANGQTTVPTTQELAERIGKLLDKNRGSSTSSSNSDRDSYQDREADREFQEWKDTRGRPGLGRSRSYYNSNDNRSNDNRDYSSWNRQQAKSMANEVSKKMQSMLTSTDEIAIKDAMDKYLKLSPTQKGYINSGLYNQLSQWLEQVKKANMFNLNLNFPTNTKWLLDWYKQLLPSEKDLINKELLAVRMKEYERDKQAEQLDAEIARFNFQKNNIYHKKIFHELNERAKTIKQAGGKVKNEGILYKYEKKIALDNLKNVPLTRDFEAIIKVNSAAQNNAPWEKIRKTANNSQRFLTTIGFLNTSNDGVLPRHIESDEKYEYFIGENITDSKVEKRLYIVSKDLSKIEVIENIGSFSFELFNVDNWSISVLRVLKMSEKEITGNTGIVSKTVGDHTIKNNDVIENSTKILQFDAKVELLKAEAYKQKTLHTINIEEDGNVLIGGYLTEKLGLSSNINNTIGRSGVKIGASIEIASVTAGWTPQTKPMLKINDDMSINFRQEKADISVKAGLKAETGAGITWKKQLTEGKVNFPLISIKLGLERPDIDGALKQIPPKVTKQIIYSYSQNIRNIIPETKRVSPYELGNFDAEENRTLITVIDEEKTKERNSKFIQKWNFKQ